MSQRERLILFDVGVRNALLGLHKRPVSRDQIGSVFEQWFILQVVALNHALRKEWSLSSYRTEGGAEVDLVVERDDDIVGIEIKATRNVRRSDVRGLLSLEDSVGRYKPVRKRVAYLAETRQTFENGVEIFPFLDLLESLRDDR